ncbi:MAG TPA: LptF/LptG family permease [Planctomycetota bacterium]|nr:LptF/LptG family permease [Planctomycetota bacterium]
MRLDRYVAGVFAGFFSLAFFLLVGLFVVVDAIGNADEYLEAAREVPGMAGTGVVGLALRYYACSVPFYFLQVAPFVTLISACAAASRLNRGGELVPMVAAGRSLQRVATPLFGGGLLVALAMLLVREGTLPRLRDLRDQMDGVLHHQRLERICDDVVALGRGGEFLLARRFYRDRDRLEGVRILRNPRDEEWIFAEVVERREAGPHGPGWYVEGGRVTPGSGSGAEVTSLEFLPELPVSPEEIYLAHKGEREPLDLSFHELSSLAGRDPARLRYQTLLHSFLTFPLANVVLLLLGLPFCLRLERRGRAEGIVVACTLCVVYFAVDLALADLGGRGVLGPLLGSWAPLVLFGSLGIVLFDGMRT